MEHPKAERPFKVGDRVRLARPDEADLGYRGLCEGFEFRVDEVDPDGDVFSRDGMFFRTHQLELATDDPNPVLTVLPNGSVACQPGSCAECEHFKAGVVEVGCLASIVAEGVLG